MAVTGLKHFIPLGSNTYLKSIISYGFNGSELIEKRPYEAEILKEFYNARLNNQTSRLMSTLHHKINSKHNFQVGLMFAHINFDYDNVYFSIPQKQYLKGQENEGVANFTEGYFSWKWRLSAFLTAVNGVHVSKSNLNGKVYIEPRMALKYQLDESQNINAAFGLHSKMASLPNHYALVYQPNGSYSMPNKHLELMQASHYVLGYENLLKSNLFLKVEAYYQHLYNIPVEDKLGSLYSLINQDDYFVDKALVNDGEGKNIGLEVTLERYFNNQYYFLLTTSLYDSKYKAKNGAWKNSRYNGNYVGNFLFGKEFTVGRKNSNDKTIGVNSRITFLGGRRYTSIDLEESIKQEKQVENEGQYLGNKADDVFYLNIAVSYRVNKQKLSHEVKLDIQNLTNNNTTIDYFYNNVKKELDEIPQLSMFPVMSYTVHF